MSEREYHLSELEIARTATDHRRILPSIPADSRRVLDLGCGAGQSLLAMPLGEAQAVGVDLDMEALELGRQFSSNIAFVRAKGEHLPFPAEAFDFVFSRVAMPYMDIPKALREIARVLRRSGQVWLTLHPFGMFPWKDSLSHPKTALFELYRLTNTLTLHCLNQQFPFPLKRARMESYQTERGMRIALRRSGFTSVHFARDAHFVVTATKL
jgi:ubiquinone/menaquinone biosynthesis C-methylase UbiE